MIRLLNSGEPPVWENAIPNSEAAVRIQGLWDSYGTDYSFLRFWTDDKGGYLALLDGAAVLSLPPEFDRSEWVWFLRANSDIATLRTSWETAEQLMQADSDDDRLCPMTYKTGVVMRLSEEGILPTNDDLPSVKSLAPREIHPVLVAGFGKDAPAFDGWYTDVSHRFRHGCGRSAGIRRDGRAAAVAMTVAECRTAALIGAVATLPEYWGHGYASHCVSALATQLRQEHKAVWLSPKNEYAHRLYLRLGFEDSGRWAQLSF